MRTRVISGLGVGTLALVGLALVPAQAQQVNGPPIEAGSGSGEYNPSMLEALARSLKITPEAAAAGLRAEEKAIQDVETLERTVPGVDGGYFGDDRKMRVNVTTSAAAEKVRAAGMIPRMVKLTQTQLAARSDQVAKAAAAKYPTAVREIGRSQQDQHVTVTLEESPNGRKFGAELASIPDVEVRYTKSPGASLQTTMIGGNSMYTSSTGGPGVVGVCTQGFSGKRQNRLVMLTVGHCYDDGRKWVYTGAPGSSTYLGQAIGNAFHWFAPIDNQSLDVGLVQLTESAGAYSSIWTHYTGYLPIAEIKAPRAMNETVCKSGQTTGWTCGRTWGYTDQVYYVERNPDQTIKRWTYVKGQWKASMCNKGGDSGGPIVEGNFAAGLLSGHGFQADGSPFPCPANSGFTYEVNKNAGVGTYFSSAGLVLASYPGTTTNF